MSDVYKHCWHEVNDSIISDYSNSIDFQLQSVVCPSDLLLCLSSDFKYDDTNHCHSVSSYYNSVLAFIKNDVVADIPMTRSTVDNLHNVPG